MKLILLVGLPGSGKSTYAAAQKLPVLSSDDTRALLLDDITNQSANRIVFAMLRRLLRARLELRRPVTCIDATNLTRAERRQYIRTAQLYGAAIEAVYFDVPLDVCKQRNLARERNVPDDIMDRMAARLRVPTLEEGFTRVEYVRATDAAPPTTPAPAATSTLPR
ncbi:MAG: AAA family ATPase [Acidobacteria bacterium]|nr:AAA family ATPase [Acidobacteriota bacterium]